MAQRHKHPPPADHSDPYEIADGLFISGHPCRSGHNRSGLICVRTLIERGTSPKDAIEKVRSARGDGHALENETFVAWLEREQPPERR